MSVGMPASLWLNQFGHLVWHAFGEYAYHVGSSVQSKTWRDVDVRVMLADAEYERLGFGDPKRPHASARWVAFCAAFSALGRQMTGLPIDFQIQQITAANAEFSSANGCVRSHLGHDSAGPMMVGLPEPENEGASYRQMMAEVDAERAATPSPSTPTGAAK